MFDNAQLDKTIIFVLIGIIAVLMIAVIALAVKRNIYYVDEQGNEIKPVSKKSAGTKPVNPAPAAVKPAPAYPKMTPLNADKEPAPSSLQEPLEVKGSSVTGVLVAVTIDGVTTESTITSFPCLMGREKASCSLVISESAVSRRHAQIIEENGNLYLEDVSEHNGTYLNGTKLPPLGRARIHQADKISLGRAEIEIKKLMY
jgi:pSer/pThr/pTyr-binding forkhead associated (FHA) protein